MAAIEASGLPKYFGEVAAVRDLTLCVQQGEVYGFLGENGAGKSTTIRMLLGLIWPDSGQAWIQGKTTTSGNSRSREAVGSIVEEPRFYEPLTVEQNLRIFGQLSGGVSSERISEALAMVGLEELRRKKAGVLSHGQKQRLGIAQALLPDNKILILDEPQNGLDPHWIKKVRELLAFLSSRGVSVLISSHRLNEIEQVCHRVGIIHRGQMLYQGTIEPLLARGARMMIRCSRPEEAARRLKENGIDGVDVSNGELTVPSESDENTGRIISFLFDSGYVIYEARRMRFTLEDVFLDLTRKGESG